MYQIQFGVPRAPVELQMAEQYVARARVSHSLLFHSIYIESAHDPRGSSELRGERLGTFARHVATTRRRIYNMYTWYICVRARTRAARVCAHSRAYVGTYMYIGTYIHTETDRT